jgi:hypothetical protein
VSSPLEELGSNYSIILDAVVNITTAVVRAEPEVGLWMLLTSALAQPLLLLLVGTIGQYLQQYLAK